MDPNGDITDAFDDDALAKSIESGQSGPWNDEAAVFEDPKLAKLKKELVVPKQTSYQERRLKEIREKALGQKTRKKVAPPPPPPPEETGDGPWGESATPVWNDHGTGLTEQTQDRRSPANEPAAGSIESTILHQRSGSEGVEPEPEQEKAAAEGQREWQRPSLVGSYAPSVFAAMLVFSAAAITHCVLIGWEVGILYRATGAIIITGILWRRFQAERLRAAVIATAVYTALFSSVDRMEKPETLFALFLGLLIVIGGAGLIGVQRDDVVVRRP